MTKTPDTPAGVLAAVAASADAPEWDDFARLYEPVLRRYARKARAGFRPLQKTDQDDIVQEAFLSVMKAMPGFRYDPAKGRFRAYLQRVVRNLAIAHQRRASAAPPVPPEPAASSEGADDDALMLEIWTLALSRVLKGPAFAPNTRAVFRRLVIDEAPVADVAAEFRMKPNAMYQVKNRVLRAVRRELAAAGQGRLGLAELHEALAKREGENG